MTDQSSQGVQSKAERNYALGPLPWSQATLESAFRSDFVEARRCIQQHPGYELEERRLSLQSALRLFNKSADSFFASLEQFNTEVHDKGLLYRSRRDDLREFDERFQEILYLFSCTAMTLVDQARAVNKKVSLPGYAERVVHTFSSNPLHKVVQELRNDVVHVTLYQPGWNISSERDSTRKTRFLLSPDQLRRTNEWTSLARQYVQEHPDGIDIGALISGYRSQVDEFHKWHQDALNTVAGDTIKDYVRCDRFLRAISFRSTWRFILSQLVIQAKRDPYSYLDRHLTAAELIEVQGLPHQTVRQVDRIVELIDEDGCCDTELRQLAYKAFGVA